MPVNKEQAEMLANLASAARPAGASRWDRAGIVAAIGKVKHLALADVALAVFRGAGDRELHTPGAIANTGSSAWRTKDAEPKWQPDVIKPQERCSICGLRQSDCARRWSTDHAFEPDIKRPAETDVAAVVEALKAEVAPTPVIAQPKPLDELLPAERNEHAEVARAALKPNEETAA